MCFFLFFFIQVLITKLRSANSVETQQYRKGSKALLVLIPLLGLTYVLVIAGPTEGTVAIYFSHIRAVLLSTQVSQPIQLKVLSIDRPVHTKHSFLSPFQRRADPIQPLSLHIERSPSLYLAYTQSSNLPKSFVFDCC